MAPSAAAVASGAAGSAPSHSKVLRYAGCADFRARVALATLSGRPLIITNIRADDVAPGLQDFEASFLRLVESICHGCTVQINDTGTSVRYTPGFLVGGDISHACAPSRSVGWYIEGILPLLPFAKVGSNVTLTGVTNDADDLSVDTLRTVTLPLMSYFGISEGLSLTVKRRGCRPAGGGTVLLTVPVVRSLTAIDLCVEGFIRRVRGIAYTCKVPPHTAGRIVEGARAVLSKVCADVHIYTDVCPASSPGYGITLTATSTSACTHSCTRAVDGSQEASTPEETGARAALSLLADISDGGCVDAAHVPLLLTFMALCPSHVCRARIGTTLSHAATARLRLLRDVWGVQFKLERVSHTVRTLAHAGTKRRADDDDEEDSAGVAVQESILATCVGIGFSNTSKKVT